MKKIIMSAIMCVALMASSVAIAQDKAPKKDQPKKECCKDKKDDKKSCCKDTAKKKIVKKHLVVKIKHLIKNKEFNIKSGGISIKICLRSFIYITPPKIQQTVS